jgi:hypothetical protein
MLPLSLILNMSHSKRFTITPEPRKMTKHL